MRTIATVIGMTTCIARTRSDMMFSSAISWSSVEVRAQPKASVQRKLMSAGCVCGIGPECQSLLPDVVGSRCVARLVVRGVRGPRSMCSASGSDVQLVQRLLPVSLCRGLLNYHHAHPDEHNITFKKLIGSSPKLFNILQLYILLLSSKTPSSSTIYTTVVASLRPCLTSIVILTSPKHVADVDRSAFNERRKTKSIQLRLGIIHGREITTTSRCREAVWIS